MKEEKKEKTILKKGMCWNPYFVDLGSNGYELSNIIIYNDDGILIETGHGWFDESNNHTPNPEIDGTCYKIRAGYENKHQKEHHNFIIKDNSCTYKDGYTLFIYYKNVNYKPIKIERKSLFIEIDYTLFNNEKIYSKAIGQSNKFSNDIYWELRKEIKATDDDGFKYDRTFEELEKHLKNIKKLMKKYIQVKQEEESYPIDAFINSTCTETTSNQESYKNNIKILNQIAKD